MAATSLDEPHTVNLAPANTPVLNFLRAARQRKRARYLIDAGHPRPAADGPADPSRQQDHRPRHAVV